MDQLRLADSGGATIEKFGAALQTAHYATETEYPARLTKVYTDVKANLIAILDRLASVDAEEGDNCRELKAALR